MRVAVFDVHQFERPFFELLSPVYGHSCTYFEPRLKADTAVLARGFSGVCVFVNDRLDEVTLELLARSGVRLVALRSAGFNNVDLQAASRFGLKVVRVPAYSPHAVAEFAVCLILALNRRIHRAYARVHELNFSLDGLVGFDLFGKKVGVVGTGRIGSIFARIMKGFGCQVLAFDRQQDPGLMREAGVLYVELERLFEEADVISLHVPLLPETFHLINASALARMKEGVMLINTSRGAIIDTAALIHGLKSGKVGFAGLDVYEEEEQVFFRDVSDRVLQDDVLARLLTFPNVLITSHQGFLTREALTRIVETTLKSISDFEAGHALEHEISLRAA